MSPSNLDSENTWVEEIPAADSLCDSYFMKRKELPCLPWIWMFPKGILNLSLKRYTGQALNIDILWRKSLQLPQWRWCEGKGDEISPSLQPSWEPKKSSRLLLCSGTLINWNQTSKGIVENKNRILKGFIKLLQLSESKYTKVINATLLCWLPPCPRNAKSTTSTYIP